MIIMTNQRPILLRLLILFKSKSMQKIFFFLFLFLFLQKNTAQQVSANLQRINSNSDEVYPFVSPDGQHLFFVRSKHESNIGDSDHADIWMSNLQADATWSSPINLGFPINNEDDNIICGISLDASVMYFTNGKNIFSTKKKGRVWSSPELLLLDLKSETNITSFVSIDEKTLIFAAKNEKSLGENDLFISLKSDSSKWSAPINVGQNINTIYDENNACLSADNRTLYFCSNKPNGIGGYDWYSSTRLDDSWQHWETPKNMGAIINTPNDDRFLSFSFDGKNAFVAQKNNNQYDIIHFPLLQKNTNEDFVLVNGTINYAEGQNASSSLVKYQSLQNTKGSTNLLSNAEGKFQVLFSDEKTLAFYAPQKNYFSSLSYINFGETPLKTIDYDANYGKISPKDSLQLYKTEMLLIRVRELNNEITALQEDPYQVEKAKNLKQKEETNFGADVNVEKLKQEFEQNDKVFTTLSNGEKSKNLEDDGLSSSGENATERSLTRLLFEQYKSQQKEKKTPKIVVHQSSNPSDDRAAIDDIAAIDGATQKRQFNDFQELTAKVKEDITNDILENVKLELFKNTIFEWTNWAYLKCSPSEERLLEKNLVDKKRLLIKQYEQQFAKAPMPKKNNEKDVIEQNLYNALLPDVRTEMFSSMKNATISEINWYMNFLLKTTLRSELQATLQKNIKHQLSKESAENIKRFTKKTAEAIAVKENKKNIRLTFYPIEIGQIIPLEGIFFASNSSDILPESGLELQRLKEILTENPKLIIEIRAHTNSALAYNIAQSLTISRASALRDELTRRGVFPDKISFNGYGKFTPLVPNNSLENRLKNQRVEFKVLAK